jgi:isopentenyl diphosphate isomerase/L-lactate dehydrogenase-like FMN-dependent dehydrogenase
MNFRLWLEQDRIEQAVLGTVGGGDAAGMTDKEEEHLKYRKVGEFGNEIIDRLKELGVVKVIADDDPSRYRDIVAAIEAGGIKVGELIDKVRGQNLAPRSDIEPV